MATLTVALLAVAGCSALSFENKRVDYKAEAGSVTALEIPPDLTKPGVEGNYTIQGAQGETVASYSDYAKGSSGSGTQQPSVECKADSVPATAQGPHGQPSGKARLVHEGGRRWLVVNDSTEVLWPTLKSFWIGLNFKLASEDAKSGLLETEWVDSRAKIEESGVRGVVAKLSDGMYVLPNRDMFRVRVERRSDGGSEIYLTHYGKEEVADSGGNTYKWQNRANDPELEAALLQQLAVRLNDSEHTPLAAAEATPSPAGAVAMIELTGGSKAIQISEAFEQSWRRVGAALEKSKQNIEDKNRAEGVYYVNTVRADQQTLYSFLGGGSGQPEHLHVKVRTISGVTQVTVTADDGSVSRAAERLRDKLFQHMK